MTTPEFQLSFLNKIQRLFAEGDFSASYKYALLIAIADIAVEAGRDDDQPLVIPHRSLGAKFVDLYWQQSAPYRNDALLIQNSGTQAAVISLIAQFRGQTHATTAFAARSVDGFKSLLTKVTRIVVDKPVFHMQNLGGTRDQFLFQSGADSITLLPGVAYCLRRFQPLVQQLARSHWIGHIKGNKLNHAVLGANDDLESFLFQTPRKALLIIGEGLKRLSNCRCFYCSGKVADADVDHFIPHSLYPRDLAHNFVLAHPACNRSKSDTLAALPHLERWLEYITRNDASLQEIGSEAGRTVNLESTRAVARWGYGNALSGEAQAWVQASLYEPVTQSYIEVLA